MVCCFAPGCNHRPSVRRCSFYRFPADVVQRRLWARAVRRADRKPSVHSRICSCHFPKGKKKVPVLFVGTNDVPSRHIFEDHSYFLREESSDANKTVPLKEVKGATQFMGDKEDDKEEQASCCRDRYSASQLSEHVLQMETGLSDKYTFSAV